MDRFEFDWDEDKAKSNLKKHKVAFSEAVSIWLDSRSLELYDEANSQSEERWVRLGLTTNNIFEVLYEK